MQPERVEEILRRKYAEVTPVLDERGRRLWAAAEAKALGRGGPSLVARATGLSRSTIHAGLRELAAGPADVPPGRSRRLGAGRKRLTDRQPGLLASLEPLVEPTSRRDPESPLRWSCKSTRSLAGQLHKQGFQIGRQKVGELLRQLGYSLQSNRKSREGSQHADRNSQFEYMAAYVAAFHSQGQPVTSVDTKKKEL